MNKEHGLKLAQLERGSFQYLGKCGLCGGGGNPDAGFQWAAISVIKDDRTLDPEEMYVVRYEFLSSEKELLYHQNTADGGKKVQFTK